MSINMKEFVQLVWLKPSLDMITILLIPLFSLIAAIYWWRHQTTAAKPKRCLPPSPPKLPVIGNLHQLGTYPHHTLQTLAQRYGPIMLLHMGSTPTLVVSSARLAREVMKTHDLQLSDRPCSETGYRLLYGGRDVATAPYGEYWRQMRSICVLQLLSSMRVRSFRSIREEEVSNLVMRIRDSSPAPVNLSDAFASVTNNVICRVALGRRYSEGDTDGREFKRMLGELMSLLGGFNVGDFIPRLAWINKLTGLDRRVDRVAKEFDDFLENVVEEHMSKSKSSQRAGVSNSYGDDGSVEGDKVDFVDVLLEIQRDESVGFRLSRVSIKALILDMFSAGTDTTYTVLEWAMTELLRHPNSMQKLQVEVRKIANGSSIVTEKDLAQMDYLKAVLKETLRLHPPIPLLVPRLALRDVNIDGYDVVAGTVVITNAWAIGRDPTSWGPDPDEFMPERFLHSTVDYKGLDFELIPFGAGRRGCPGTVFAMATNELVLANLVLSFGWGLPQGMRAGDLDMTQCTGLTIHRKVPLLAVPTPCFS